MVKSLASCLLVAAFVIGCGSTGPSPSGASASRVPTGSSSASSSAPSPEATPEQVLALENRGGPTYAIYINDELAATVECDGDEFIDAADFPLPWDLKMVWVDSNTTVLTDTVAKLPAWITQFGTKAPKISYFPVIGPVLDCPSPGASAPTESSGASQPPSHSFKP